MLTMYSLVVCCLYYVGWVCVIPKARGYRIRQGLITLDNGAKTHRLFKVPVAELTAWDATHDALGRDINDASCTEQDVQSGEKIIDKAWSRAARMRLRVCERKRAKNASKVLQEEDHMQSENMIVHRREVIAGFSSYTYLIVCLNNQNHIQLDDREF